MPVVKFPIDLVELKGKLAENGLSVLGALRLANNHCAAGEGVFSGQYAILVGNEGGKMWSFFAQSPEYGDGGKDPMNRWTRRMLSKLTHDADCELRYPFDKPYWPFQRIACEAMGIKSSPLGILIHPEFGLWHAFRAIIIVSPNNDLAEEIQNMIHQAQKLIHPCEICPDKPCLTACPVSAFNGTSLDREACFQHLDEGNEPHCMKSGCMARNTCPVGSSFKYENAQIEFHMKSYRGA